MRHLSTESCLLTCHSAELKPAHAAQVTATTVTCSGCHPTLVGQVKPWDGTCTACHATAVADHAPASHVGTDVAVQDASFFGNGCSNSPVHTDQSNCHDISSLTKLHASMPGRGCSVCHGAGNTPKKECLDCHQEGRATTYAKPGTIVSSTATSYPSTDASITSGWTWTTTPAAQPRYAVVNTPYPPANTTRYVSVTSTNPGGMLFGFDRPSIPSNARIVSVRVYAKAEALSSSNPRKMNGWFGIGGQTFLSSNQSNNIPYSSFWGGAGQGFSTSPTRLDYTRDSMYGELIYQNPKTGQDWTPDELNSAGPDSLDSFGVWLTGSSGANNICVSQVYLSVDYYVMSDVIPWPTVGSSVYHHNNVKYLHDPADAAGKRFAVNPAHGWYDALFNQDCYDYCHYGNGGAPTFTASQGTWMWYSVGGDPMDPVAATRTLRLKPITIPAGSPKLDFVTNYRLGAGAAGYVEISTDGGNDWVTLTGTVGGAGKSSLTGNASGWVAASYDLSAYTGQSAVLRFRYVNGTSTAEGWAFDSLSISGTGGTVFSDDAETLKPDWTNQYWTRSKGAYPYQ